MAVCPECKKQTLRAGEALCPHCQSKQTGLLVAVGAGFAFLSGVLGAIAIAALQGQGDDKK